MPDNRLHTVNEAASILFDSQLGPLGLTEEAIVQQSEPELEESARRLDKLLEDPVASLPTLGFKLEALGSGLRPILARNP
jgi:hypothetical protein